VSVLSCRQHCILPSSLRNAAREGLLHILLHRLCVMYRLSQNLAKSKSLLCSAALLPEDSLLAVRMSAVFDGKDGSGESLPQLAESISVLQSAVLCSGDLPLAFKMSAVLEGRDGRGDCRGRVPLGGVGLLRESRLADRFGEVLLLLLDVPPSLISDCSIWMDSKKLCQGHW